MKTKHRQSGLTLMEEAIVVAVIALLVVFGLPAVRALFRSIESEGGAKAMISASLASARAIAAKEQHYAGVRFQNRYQEDGKGCQYMIFIINDTEIRPGEQGNLGCRAVEGLQPIKLPDSVGVMDLLINKTEEIDSDIRIDTPAEVNDTTTFSILFSPSGKLVIHKLWVRNRDNANDSSSKDDIFNTETNINNKIGMFIQDESSDIEPSRNSFIIYDKTIFEKLKPDSRYDDYLEDLASQKIYINPYIGTMINRD